MARGWVVVGENNVICLTQMAGNLKPIISIPDKHLEIKHQKTLERQRELFTVCL